jgi:hypothetical protein
MNEGFREVTRTPVGWVPRERFQDFGRAESVRTCLNLLRHCRRGGARLREKKLLGDALDRGEQR